MPSIFKPILKKISISLKKKNIKKPLQNLQLKNEEIIYDDL
jgi:hypothetical protein